MKKIKAVVVLVAVLSVAGFAGGAVIPPTHVNDNNPTTEGLTASGSVSGSAVGGYWEMTITGAPVGRYIASQADAGGSDRTLTAIGFMTSSSGDINLGMSLMYEPESDNSVQLNFLDDLSGIRDRVSLATYAVDTSVEHIYQIVRTGGNPGTMKAYVDGNFAFNMTAAEWAGLDFFTGYFAGSASSAASSVSSWRLWQVEEGVNIVTPEPTTTGLLGLGAILVVLKRRR